MMNRWVVDYLAGSGATARFTTIGQSYGTKGPALADETRE